jgi:serine/threonine-protein kinase
VVLTDFGLFKPECDHTPSPWILGTPEYMAPEIVRGEVAPGELFLVDVYALGVVLFQMLTGRAPFLAAPAPRVLWLQLTEPPPDPLRLRREAPPELASLVRQMLAKSPGARPQDMHEVGWRLRHPRARRSCGAAAT